MRSGEFYDFTQDELLKSYMRANKLCARLQTMTFGDSDYREVIEALIPGIPQSATVAPPFHCDHGHGIRLGENVFINYNGTMLDGGLITIGETGVKRIWQRKTYIWHQSRVMRYLTACAVWLR